MGLEPVNYFIFALKSVVLRKLISYLVIVCVLGSGTLAGCSPRSAQQKKTSKYQKMSNRGKAPCTCDSN